ncbi:hypothetical protein [Devosia sp. Root413D1]|uniref:hypothetical protein n=1 Tax=Devosia sp. Root413D1 TaxID=1736531 RepID=UPI0012E3881C|nr:hypothetical protein [Devosia sp. Root413D1]
MHQAVADLLGHIVVGEGSSDHVEQRIVGPPAGGPARLDFRGIGIIVTELHPIDLADLMVLAVEHAHALLDETQAGTGLHGVSPQLSAFRKSCRLFRFESAMNQRRGAFRRSPERRNAPAPLEAVEEECALVGGSSRP